VLRAGDAPRPPLPPGYGSPTFLVDARELVKINADLTEEQRRIARYWDGGGTSLPPGVWNDVVLRYLRDHRASGPEAVRTLALVNVAMADAGVAAWDAKYAYWTPRSENAIRDLIDPAWVPLLKTFPAYVSGHSTYSATAAEVLSYLFPAEASTFRAMGDEAGLSRLFGGIHYRSDHAEGSRMGHEIGRLVVVRARADRTD